MDKQDYPQAAQLYREVLDQAPALPPALRRLGVSLAGLGQTSDGLAQVENAANIERWPENLASLPKLNYWPIQAKRQRAPRRKKSWP
jgi:hypothetical protein